ncbi:MAG TPA: S1 RNA-binding domain-containing protein [Candidatus Pacearchaeota archaeon]|jgi:small subunit ribosomal protein S1|nr:S1 RNA-binding domain-containing protein [Candidatus Pacearchaeota archaeon]HPC30815.1 S1 RNA-binding domain-containing protein [Candidatus Pacearchaeota archaeon]HQG09492.1 S1 RNA-binding domain-containing protein [Candidatus Pacearchaeota archaeon]HQH20439.1 S1 RNA-binding domain-containing protein [Candidatus Pacearchaeota archaeon]HQK58715.1 S1 RNA-binding domain-containing protein [Candidatus Pacearchaeota archaeon]
MQNETLQKLINSVQILRAGDIVDGRVLAIENLAIFLDLGPRKTGIIYGAEYQNAKNVLKNIKIGDIVSVKVIEPENEDGYVELSLREAEKELAWKTIKEIKEQDKELVVKITKVNKGGLIAEISGVPAFLPTSQLSPEKYPRVPEGDKAKILRKLQTFIGQEMKVKILDFDERAGQIILTEESKENDNMHKALQFIKVGDIVEGKISGVVNFGAFIKFAKPGETLENVPEDELLEGLIHISELDWQLVEDPAQVVKVGEKVKAQIVDITQSRVSLSIKNLKKDPWQDLNLKAGDIVKGEVARFNSFGAFIQIKTSFIGSDSPKIQGLIHISEFGSEDKMKEKLEIGKEYDFQILSFQPQRHWMSLHLKNN